MKKKRDKKAVAEKRTKNVFDLNFNLKNRNMKSLCYTNGASGSYSGAFLETNN